MQGLAIVQNKQLGDVKTMSVIENEADSISGEIMVISLAAMLPMDCCKVAIGGLIDALPLN